MTGSTSTEIEAKAKASPAPGCDPVLSLEGEMTIVRALELKQSLLSWLERAERGASLNLDLRAVTELDTSGVQLLLLVRALAATKACKVRLVELSAAVRKVLALLSLEQTLGVSPEPSEASS